MVRGTVRTNGLFSYLPLFPSSPLSFKDITDLGLSCMADYGAPVFPFLAVGGYQGESSAASCWRRQKASVQHSASSLKTGEDFTNAEALLLTFSLNNYPRNNPKFNVAMQWETEFLKIVQEYQRNASTNFTFAYMAEVRPALRAVAFKRSSFSPLTVNVSSAQQRSLEDEINRTTAEDIPIFMISYAVIFVYIAVALGEYTSWRRILVRQDCFCSY